MKFIPHLLWLVGVIALLHAFGRYTGVSMHQDLTPELLAVQRAQIKTAKIVALTGGLLCVSGISWVVIRRRRVAA